MDEIKPDLDVIKLESVEIKKEDIESDSEEENNIFINNRPLTQTLVAKQEPVEITNRDIGGRSNEWRDYQSKNNDRKLVQYARDTYIVEKQRDEIFNKNEEIVRCSAEEVLVINNVNVTAKTRQVFDHEIVQIDADKYQCFYCTYNSTSRSHIMYHVKALHKNPRKKKTRNPLQQCPHCPKQTRTLPQHILARHTDDADIEWQHCKDCKYKCKTPALLKSHVYRYHTDRENMEIYICEKCGREFVYKKELCRHIAEVHQKDKFPKIKCDQCSYSSPFIGRIRNHVRMVHGIPKEEYKCSKCEFTTEKKKVLSRHHFLEHKEWLQCHLCPYKTKGTHVLRLHLIRHKPEKEETDFTFKCDKCSYKTYRSYSFTIHQLTHKKPDEIEMFRCYLCHFKAKRKDNLKNHIFKHDIYRNILKCFVCGFQTRSEIQLTEHVDKHSESEKTIANENKLERAKRHKRIRGDVAGDEKKNTEKIS